MNQTADDRIFQLLAHNEEMAKIADKAVKGLSGEARTAIREILASEAQKASEGLLEASSEAEKTLKSMRRAWVMPSVILLALALVITGVGYGVSGYVIDRRAAELDRLKAEIAGLKAEIAREQTTLAELQKKTWSLTLVEYNDGRGIELPRGVQFERSATLPDGRTVLILLGRRR